MRREEALTGRSMSAERAAGMDPGARQHRGLPESQIMPRLQRAQLGTQPKRLTKATELPC